MTGLSGARVLVTGANGSIGSHLAERLLDERADVIALCEFNSQCSSGWLDELPPEKSQRRLWPPLHRQPPYKATERCRGDVEGRVCRRGLSLPSSSHPTEAEQRAAIKNLKELLQ